ncbi:MAG: TRAM domain-containing protein, partial [Colwellia sp.]
MANFFKANPKKSVILSQVLTLNINKLDVNGCGIGQYKQKSIFVNGTLPNENVDVRLIEQKNKYDRARLVKVNKSSE